MGRLLYGNRGRDEMSNITVNDLIESLKALAELGFGDKLVYVSGCPGYQSIETVYYSEFDSKDEESPIGYRVIISGKT